MDQNVVRDDVGLYVAGLHRFQEAERLPDLPGLAQSIELYVERV